MPTEISTPKLSISESKSNKQNLVENLHLKRRTKLSNPNSKEVTLLVGQFKELDHQEMLCNRLVNKPKLLSWQEKETEVLPEQSLRKIKLVIVKDHSLLLTKRTGMIQDTSKNRDKLLLNSRRSRKNSREPLLRKKRRSPRRRRRLDLLVVMFSMLRLMMINHTTFLASVPSKNLSWMRMQIVTLKKKR